MSDHLREPGHLPSRQPGGRRLPRQRRGITPQMVGRYPDFDVLSPSIIRHWDEATRKVVVSRTKLDPSFGFFSAQEVPTLRAFCDTVTEQIEEPRVPVAEMIDHKLAEGKLDGFRYATMPDDRDTWHRSLAGLDWTARERYGREDFPDLPWDARRAVVDALQRGLLTDGPWKELDPGRTFSVLMRAVVSEFYSHPWAWNEIGFAGPAYPRGFMRFGPLSTEEPYETPDRVNLDVVRDVEVRGLP
ncbi:MAG: gluconate 2-dehydrogenase subunit 3 family protein [Candidatus Dormibacteraeota bacterium]|nr:gluconate 2-dehydrogenase subunit 3 family protein [Candidatus Dormibacteraeota bacterium]